MEKEYSILCNSPIGTIEITGNSKGISSLYFTGDSSSPFFQSSSSGDSSLPFEAEACPILKECVKQLDEYFSGKRQTFDLKLDIKGTEFQKKVWNELLKIPFGETITYSEIAKRIGSPKVVRAVGNANGRNKISIIIPCHRVIGSDKSLTGYGGGIWRKKYLLSLEGHFSFK